MIIFGQKMFTTITSKYNGCGMPAKKKININLKLMRSCHFLVVFHIENTVFLSYSLRPIISFVV